MQRSFLAAVLALSLALPLAAEAQSFRCVGKDGKKHYGQSMPPQCVGQPAEQLNAQGLVVRRIDPQASADERAKKETDEADRKKQAAQAKDQGRRDNALLATYASEKDVELSRARALEDNNRVARELEGRIADLRKKRAAPGADAKGIDMELKTQEDLLAGRKKETERINARYDDDKKRYAEITKRGK
jgi:Domain of unknown function (DUF4124)